MANKLKMAYLFNRGVSGSFRDSVSGVTNPITGTDYTWNNAQCGRVLTLGNTSAVFANSGNSTVQLHEGANDGFSAAIAFTLNINPTVFPYLFNVGPFSGVPGEGAILIYIDPSRAVHWYFYRPNFTVYIYRYTANNFVSAGNRYEMVFNYSGGLSVNNMTVYNYGNVVPTTPSTAGVWSGFATTQMLTSIGTGSGPSGISFEYIQVFNRALSLNEINFLSYDPYAAFRPRSIALQGGFRPVSKTPSNFLALI